MCPKYKPNPMRALNLLFFFALNFLLLSCSTDDYQAVEVEEINDDNTDPGTTTSGAYLSFLNIDLQNLENYFAIDYPDYYGPFLNQTNVPNNNATTNAGATLGRVLFFDKNLSVNNTISCASCHLQSNAFDDPNQFSTGFEGGQTTAHAMRLLNLQFYAANEFFWDRRAPSLEAQSTQPIQDGTEMGFDAAHGGFQALITKMDGLAYYPELFEFVFGTSAITETRVQNALAQYMRAMVSTNSKFDTGYAQVYDPQVPNGNLTLDFPNFTAQENLGKRLFINPPNQGGVGCASCHQAPTFALAINSRSNGLDAGETTIFKSPSLKSVSLSNHFMHDGRFNTLAEVIEHYNSGIQAGPALDNRLRPNGTPLRLNLTQEEKDALVAFLTTLVDTQMVADNRFSDPFIN